MTTPSANKILAQLASQITGLQAKIAYQPQSMTERCDTASDIGSIIEQLGEFVADAQILLHGECMNSTGFGISDDVKGYKEDVASLTSDLLYEVKYAVEEERRTF